jgi:hypothetical protein
LHSNKQIKDMGGGMTYTDFETREDFATGENTRKYNDLLLTYFYS